MIKKQVDPNQNTNTTIQQKPVIPVQHFWMYMLGLCGLLFVFALGYSVGYQSSLKKLLKNTREESFSDRINYALYSLSFQDNDAQDTEEESTSTKNIITADVEDSNVIQEESAVMESVQEEPQKQIPSYKITTIYTAPLAGFGTEEKAQQFVEKIKTIDPYAVVKKRISKTAKGKTIAWYQAVTGEFDNQDDLNKVLNHLREKEHLKNIKVVEKRKAVVS